MRSLIFCAGCVSLAGLAATNPKQLAAAESFAQVIDANQSKMVKIYGAGGVRGLEAYQSGFLISAEGHVLTVWSYVLDTDYITVTLSDGRKFEAKLLGADPRLELAVLKIETTELSHFELAASVPADSGSRVLAFSNLFGVAAGDEPSSVQHGTIAVKTRLDARRGTFETPYHGPVYVLDAMTNNPGAAGGALTNQNGELLAMLGKELQNAQNNIWLNYAVPIDELRGSVDQILAGKFRPGDDKPPVRAAEPVKLSQLGIVLVPDVLERTPPYVDEVRPGSPGEHAGLKPDDLIVFVGENLVHSCKGFREELARLERDAELRLVLMRGQELVEVVLKPVPPGESQNP
ncbi:MAG TPA: trypsin-like peptidase domain-containing protein [Pirellulales bacterium]|jgi:serine protease Do|nr:trypsin-like peptidase domain-containing protein [Pirellulales bacterium]